MDLAVFNLTTHVMNYLLILQFIEWCNVTRSYVNTDQIVSLGFVIISFLNCRKQIQRRLYVKSCLSSICV